MPSEFPPARDHQAGAGWHFVRKDIGRTMAMNRSTIWYSGEKHKFKMLSSFLDPLLALNPHNLKEKKKAKHKGHKFKMLSSFLDPL